MYTFVPLLKSENLDSTVSENYRSITISPCVSKVFEMCLMDCFQYWLVDELQFGFHKGIGLQGCNLCALGMSKAFDKMSHYGLYIKLSN